MLSVMSAHRFAFATEAKARVDENVVGYGVDDLHIGEYGEMASGSATAAQCEMMWPTSSLCLKEPSSRSGMSGKPGKLAIFLDRQ